MTPAGARRRALDHHRLVPVERPRLVSFATAIPSPWTIPKPARTTSRRTSSRADNGHWNNGSGDEEDWQEARDAQRGQADPSLWVRRGDERFLITDAKALERAAEIFKPQEALGQQQAELGRRQGELGGYQGEMGRLQGRSAGCKRACARPRDPCCRMTRSGVTARWSRKMSRSCARSRGSWARCRASSARSRAPWAHSRESGSPAGARRAGSCAAISRPVESGDRGWESQATLAPLSGPRILTPSPFSPFCAHARAEARFLERSHPRDRLCVARRRLDVRLGAQAALVVSSSRPTSRNRIRLSMRCLLLEGEGRRILVDDGAGDKMSPKLADIYRIQHDEQSLERSLAQLGSGSVTSPTWCSRTYISITPAARRAAMASGWCRPSARALLRAASQPRERASAQSPRAGLVPGGELRAPHRARGARNLGGTAATVAGCRDLHRGGPHARAATRARPRPRGRSTTLPT